MLRELILGNVLDINQSAELSPDIRGKRLQRGPSLPTATSTRPNRRPSRLRFPAV